jgi:hypothetical protein
LRLRACLHSHDCAGSVRLQISALSNDSVAGTLNVTELC